MPPVYQCWISKSTANFISKVSNISLSRGMNVNIRMEQQEKIDMPFHISNIFTKTCLHFKY